MLAIMRSAIPIIIAGIVLWTIALIIAIIVNALAKIILTCVLGITLGFIGIRYTKTRAEKRYRAARDQDALLQDLMDGVHDEDHFPHDPKS